MAKTGPIVIVEDDEDDIELYRDSFHTLAIKNELRCFSKADEALYYLINTKEKPFFILSDINIPGMSGLDFKKKIDEDPYLRQKSIPFIFLTTSASDAAVKHAYSQISVQGFFEKPILMNDLHAIFKMIVQYWSVCRHPNS